MTPMTTATLPPAIESQLANLEARHARHRRLHEDHATRKSIARERHRDGWHRRRHAPNTLI